MISLNFCVSPVKPNLQGFKIFIFRVKHNIYKLRCTHQVFTLMNFDYCICLCNNHLKIRNELILSSSPGTQLRVLAQEAEAAWLCGTPLQGHPASLSLSFPICQTPNPPGEPLPPGDGACALLCETEGNEAQPQGHRNNTFPASLPHSLWTSALSPSLCSFCCLLGTRGIRGQA